MLTDERRDVFAVCCPHCGKRFAKHSRLRNECAMGAHAFKVHGDTRFNIPAEAVRAPQERDDVRAEFEAWIANNPTWDMAVSRFSDGRYRDSYTHSAWTAWCAGRIEGLREAARIADGYSTGFIYDPIHKAIKAIREAAGEGS